MSKKTTNHLTQLQQAMTVAVAALQEGEVVSYADIAELAGTPGAARAVGSWISKTPMSVPWWRVVYSDGRLPPCNPDRQRELLEDEGVIVENARVVEAPLGRFAS